jgi:hypothetical protein
MAKNELYSVDTNEGTKFCATRRKQMPANPPVVYVIEMNMVIFCMNILVLFG